MVHLRLNENEANPNPHVNFIAALPMRDPRDQEQARQLLRALAAQVRPVMKSHGFVVNSLEEYEHNNVFAGRNWNNGETVELVLRRRDGSFVSTSWLMGTLCHELAHIKHMNHGSDFQALWSQLRREVVALQAKGYYGDGMWSSGTRLADSATVSGNMPTEDDLPEYMCGGAQSRARPSGRRRRRQPIAGPSTHTGAQTVKRRKAGSRVTAAGAFVGDGLALNVNADDTEKTAGAGFRRKAGSKRAREERALAAERRLRALQGGVSRGVSALEHDDVDSDSETVEELRETDQERRQTMLDSMDASDVDRLKTRTTLADFWGSFILPKRSASELGDEPEDARTKDTGTSRASPQGSDSNTRTHTPSSTAYGKHHLKPETPGLGLKNLVQDEIRLRKRESLGLTASKPNRTLGATPSDSLQSSKADSMSHPSHMGPESCKWPCLVCTLDNEPNHLACSACATPRGDTHWQGTMH
ncbi:WLM domain-containing protein [Gloeopeniophorella convolvens]|nr:WLM domain-containing protein [Gloeopeniophorella convolvens]